MAHWEIEYTDQFEEWWDTLTEEDQRAVTAAMELLERDGPALGRPVVDTISGSRHANMKELRALGTFIRVLFAFDPRRTAILLIGGNKARRWRQWYREFFPIADRLYDEHIRTLRCEGEIP